MVKRIGHHKTFLFFALLAGTALVLGSIWVYTSLAVPDFTTLRERKIIESTKIYDRSGEVLLYDIHGEVKRTVIAFENIPRHIKNATVAIEDVDFYTHHGISLRGLGRAFLSNLLSGKVRQGGSTITQQLVKNTFLTPERTLERKIKELVLALKTEVVYTKDEILHLYLNEIPYGANSYGVEAASQSYFGKSAGDLSLTESAYLAALPKAPTYYSPYGNNRDKLEIRKDVVLERMRSLGFITEEEFEKAKNEKVRFIHRGVEGIRAAHFVLLVRELLVEKYGEDVVERGGLKVRTTLNWEWQEKAEELVRRFAEENEKKFDANNAGLVALDPKTGQILVMVGSRDFFAKPKPEGCLPGINCQFDPQVNMALRSRQPGSAFKPFVYATAFTNGYTPETVLFDLPTEFNPACTPEGKPGPGISEEVCYHPQNYDEKFRGPVSLREALAQSINVPSVKVLYLAGLSDSLRLAQKMGIKTLNQPERYGLTLVLGGGEVKLLELAGAYEVFANDGIFQEPVPILKIEDSSGKVWEEYREKPIPALEPNVARIISDILSDNKARAPAFGESSYLYFPERQVAVKTGTTNDYRDAWVMGYTPNIVAGVWVGNSDNTPMEKKVAGFIAAPLWNAFLKEVFNELAREEFPKSYPQPARKPVLKGEWRGGRVYTIDKISQKLATPFTPEELIEEKVVQEIHSILYWLEKDNPDGPPLQNPYQNPQFKNWETPIRSWALEKNLRDEDEAVIPTESDPLHLPEFEPNINFILNPGGETFKPETTLFISFAVGESRFPIKQIDLFLDSRYIGSSRDYPYELSLKLDGAPGEIRELKARIYDEVGNKAILSKTIQISE